MMHVFAMAGWVHHGTGGGGGGAHSAPEINGGAGMMALALIVTAGILAYARYRKK